MAENLHALFEIPFMCVAGGGVVSYNDVIALLGNDAASASDNRQMHRNIFHTSVFRPEAFIKKKSHETLVHYIMAVIASTGLVYRMTWRRQRRHDVVLVLFKLYPP